MSRMSFRLTRLFVLLLAAGAALAPIGCDRKVQGERPEDGSNPPSTAPATRATSIELGKDMAGDLRRKAEAGDVQAMMVLGRFHESRNSVTDRAEARKWYQRAADAGDASAADALRSLDG